MHRSRRKLMPLLFLAAGLGAVMLACRPAPLPPPALETPAFGVNETPVEVLAFIDFECPYSRQEGGVLRDLAARYPEQVHVRVLYLPLDQHPHSVVAARAAVAADAQRAFMPFWQKWLRPDAGAPTLSREALIAWSVEAGLDAKRFATALDNPATLTRVARDVAIGHALGITGTPSFLVNGTLLQGLQSLDTLDAAVKHEVTEIAILRAAGAQADKLVHARVAHNAPSLLANYQRYVERGELASPQPVPMRTQKPRAGEVASAQLQPAALGRDFGGPRALLLPDQPTASDATVWRVVVRADDPQVGEATAPMTLVVFLDLFAQDTAALLPWLLQLPQAQPKQVRVVFKHLPRPVHPLAHVVADALEAAREQGRYAPLLHRLVEAPPPLTEATILAIAGQLGLDASRFSTALAAHSGKARIDADEQQAAALGVTGFGALYVNGIAVREWTQTAVQAAIDAQLRRAADLTQRGVQPGGLYEALTGAGRLLDTLGTEVHAFDLSHAAVQGLPGAPVQVVVFGDFACPFTARLWPHLRKLDEEMPGRLKIAWLDFPQTTAHPLAEQLAEAGQEARRQGKFWEFMQALARRVDLLDDRSLGQAAHDAGLKDRPLQQALAQHHWTQAVQAERAQGEHAGVRATPTVFLDGHLFAPTMGLSAETLRPAIQRLLSTH